MYEHFIKILRRTAICEHTEKKRSERNSRFSPIVRSQEIYRPSLFLFLSNKISSLSPSPSSGGQDSVFLRPIHLRLLLLLLFLSFLPSSFPAVMDTSMVWSFLFGERLGKRAVKFVLPSSSLERVIRSRST